MISTFANPHRFMKFTQWMGPALLGLGIVILVWGLYQGLVLAPADYRQGDAARIMFVHVPAAMMCMGVYAFMVLASLSSLIWKHALADIAAKSAAPVGAVFTLICLITGSLWGKPIWNTWWEWDARLTSVLVLFFIYLGYMAIWSALETPQKAGRAAAILCLVAAVNIPIIKWSVDWWSTLHQQASITLTKISLPADYIVPLFTMLAAYGVLFGALVIMNMRAEIFSRRAEMLVQRQYASMD